MRAKLLEVRVGEEVIPIMVVDTKDDTGSAREWLLRRSGYRDGGQMIAIVLEIQQHISSYAWGKAVREYIQAFWSQLDDGDVIDVDWLRKIITEPRNSARYEV